MRSTITREEYQAEWAAGWPNIHPEDYCQRCLNRNITWTIASDRFNLAVKALGLRSTSIICIACFVEGHMKATGLRCSWTISPFTHFSWREEGDS
jgi:hypothetical protein